MRAALLWLVCWLLLPVPAFAQDGAGEEIPLPEPHLGYGINVGPHFNGDPGMVGRLGMDWVKVYDLPDISKYPNQRVLYRINVQWTTNFAHLRAEVGRQAREAFSRGVDALEIGNEPNLFHEWPNGPNAWQYTQVLRASYQVVKDISPELVVVSAGLASTLTTPDRHAIDDLEYAREMLDNGAAQWFDAFGYHPYGYNQPPEADPYEHELVFRRVERVRELLLEFGIRDKQIWITEFGWLRTPREEGVNCDGHPNFQGFEWMQFPGDLQATYTVRAFEYADRHWPWVGPMFLWNLNWHTYEENYAPLCEQMRWFGILNRDGSPNATYRAVQGMEKRYSDYLPRLEIWVEDMTETVEAFCPGAVYFGNFSVLNVGYPHPLAITVEPAEGANMPRVAVSPNLATSGDVIDVWVDPGDVDPGTHMIIINVRTIIDGQSRSTHVQGWVMANAGTTCR
jgi:hypothetical protein